MTTKDIAAATGKTERTVRNWATKLAEKSSVVAEKIAASSPSIPADYDLEETVSLIEIGLGKNAADLYRMSAAQPASSSLSQRDIDMISAIVSRTVAMTIRELDNRMATIEERIDKRQELLPPPQVDKRSALNRRVREYCHRSETDYNVAWNALYREYGYRTHSNAIVSARNRGMTVLDYIEEAGDLPMLLSISIDMWGAL